MDLGLEGKVALITGASQGIGESVARSLAMEGCATVLAARNRVALESLAAGIEARGGQTLVVQTDMSDLGQIQQLTRTALERFGRIDILVNNAGSSQFGTLFEVPDERWMSDIITKLIGYVRACREIVPVMQRQGGGKIINIAGNSGKQPLPYHLSGGSANAGVLNFTRSLAEQVAPDGILVIAVSPGPVVTPRFDNQVAAIARQWGVEEDEARRRFAAELPLGRVPEPSEIADLVAFLASSRNTYITGTSVTIDGGITKGI